MSGQVFVSHNSDDSELISNLSECLSRMEYRMFIASFENIGGYCSDNKISHGQKLREEIEDSEALIFHMDAGAEQYINAWVAWELGVAASSDKQIIVVEESEHSYDIPVPYLDDYIIYSEEESDMKEVRDCFTEVLDGSTENPAMVKCDHSTREETSPCMQEFRAWLDADNATIKCPSCRRNLLSSF